MLPQAPTGGEYHKEMYYHKEEMYYPKEENHNRGLATKGSSTIG